jgi:hypothetical protein
MNPKCGVRKVQSEEIEKSHLLVAADIASLEKMTAGLLGGGKPRCRLHMFPV